MRNYISQLEVKANAGAESLACGGSVSDEVKDFENALGGKFSLFRILSLNYPCVHADYSRAIAMTK